MHTCVGYHICSDSCNRSFFHIVHIALLNAKTFLLYPIESTVYLPCRVSLSECELHFSRLNIKPLGLRTNHAVPSLRRYETTFRCSTPLSSPRTHSRLTPMRPSLLPAPLATMHSASVSPSQILPTLPPSRVSALPLRMNVNPRSSTGSTCSFPSTPGRLLLACLEL